MAQREARRRAAGGRAPGGRWALAALVAAAALVPAAVADDWPRYLGPHQDGTSRETGLALPWPEGGPPRLWEKRLGPSFSPPVVAGGRLVAFHRLGDHEVVECLDARTGRPVWEARYPTRYKDRYGYNGGPRSSPTIDGGRVYTYGAEGTLSCFDLETGRLLWRRALNRDLGAPQAFFGVGVPPVVEGDVILLNPGAPNGAGLVGVDKHTGRLRWKATDHGASYSTPVVRTVLGRRMAFFLTADGLTVVAPGTGEVLYEYPFRSVFYESVNAASPVVVDDVVFLSAAYGVGSAALQVTADGLEPLWRDREGLQSHWATPVHRDGCLYGTHGRHEAEAEIRCLDALTGTVLWRGPRGLGRTTFTWAQGMLITMGERGVLALVKATPEGYAEAAPRVKVLAPPCWGPPVLADGLLYVRNETRLVCLDLRRKGPGEGGGRGGPRSGSPAEGAEAR